ncbi:hypothetical protein [Archangium sp.]|uniref:hypothetical protein n=1 Tax=Archangium sp. TaxID=1872627 RepID=UPI00389A9D93
MKRNSFVIAFAFLLSFSGAALATVVTVTGHGQSYDPGLAMDAARTDAIAKCTAQGGTPLDEVYSHMTRSSLWLADVVMRCGVP